MELKWPDFPVQVLIPRSACKCAAKNAKRGRLLPWCLGGSVPSCIFATGHAATKGVALGDR